MEPRDTRNTTSDREPDSPPAKASTRRGRASRPAGPRAIGTDDPIITSEPVSDPDWIGSSRSDHGHRDEPRSAGRTRRSILNFVMVPVEPSRSAQDRSGDGDGRKQADEDDASGAETGRRDGKKDQSESQGGPRRAIRMSPATAARTSMASRPRATFADPHVAALGRRGPGLRGRRRLGLLVLLRVVQVGRSEVFGQGLRVEQGLRLQQGLRTRAKTPDRARIPTRARTPIRVRARTCPTGCGRGQAPPGGGGVAGRGEGAPSGPGGGEGGAAVRRKRRRRSWISSRTRCCRRAARGMCRWRRPSGPAARART